MLACRSRRSALVVRRRLAALALTAYESLEYGRTIVLGLLALLLFLFFRTRRSYRHG